MGEHRTISVQHELIECTVGEANCENVLMFRAPIIRDGTGTYKRMPHQIEWKHVQVGDVIFALSTHPGPSQQGVVEVLQFWHVLEQIDEISFRVEVNNIVGMASDGEYVYRLMASLAGAPLN